VTLEDYPGALADDGQDDASGDAVSINEERERAFEVRDRLVERANRLSEALDRLRSGDYGICQVCGEPISAGRLRAIPEVTTCVTCQDAAERRATVSRQSV
jgi:DnaK suppressor protein